CYGKAFCGGMEARWRYPFMGWSNCRTDCTASRGSFKNIRHELRRIRLMKILYFYQYFSTPKGAWGTRVYEFAREWVEQGHEVTVVSSIYSKSDLTASKLIEDQYFDGIHVKVLNLKVDNKQPFLKRIWSFLAYALFSSYYALVLKADVVVASSGPITVGLPGLLAKYVRGRKLVFETRDLWPEGAIELGIIKNPLLKKAA